MATITDTPVKMFLGSHSTKLGAKPKDLMQIMIQQIQNVGTVGEDFYQLTSDERKRVAEMSWKNPAYDVLGEMEIFSDIINGYVSWLSRPTGFSHPQEAMNKLYVNCLMDYPALTEFLRKEGKRFPKLCTYVELQDHLRTLLIAFLMKFYKVTFPETEK